MISNALAVHDLGAFELDGNAVNDSATAGDDWDNVCHQVAGDCSTSNNTSGATAVSWSNDCNDGSTTCTSDDPTSTSDRSASTFTGGGSKDPQNISAWAWNDGSGGLPDKDNLVHSYAARYLVTGASQPPPNTTDCAPGTTCDVIYFGLDRFDNSGDAQTGFWFLQNKCAQGTNKVGGGTGFACVDPTPGSNPSDDYHMGFDTCTDPPGPATCGPGESAKGDLLVLSDFSNGGTTSTISIYRWDPTCKKAGGKSGDANTCGDANLALLRSSTNANCGTPGLVGDDFCGLVNATTTTMPWSFTDKSGTAGSGALNGEFYEAGINLTPLGLGGECFATLVSETRSSTSTTATLKDFIVSPFAPCQAGLETSVDATDIDTGTTGTQVNPKTQVRDHATITGNQAGKIPGVSDGDSKVVTFFLCKNTDPLSSTYNSCPAGSGDNIGTGTLSTVSGSNVKSEAYSPYVNCAADGAGCFAGKNPLSTGHYCFRAEWTGDANYSTKLVEDGSISPECFDVVVIPTDIKTKQSWYPNDTATITSTQSGDNLAANGTVVFTLHNNATCSGTPLYKETKDTGSAAHSVELSTGNPGHGDPASPGGPATSYSENTAYADPADSTTTDRSWKVVYTPPSGDNAHTGVQSSCTTTAPAHIEKHSYKYTNDPGTLPNP